MNLIVKAVCLSAIAFATPGICQTITLSDSLRADGERQVALAGKLLADKVRDTEGTKFRDVFLRKTIGKDGVENVMVCGQINSRNAYGGMSGFHAFMLVGESVFVGGPGQIINADDVCFNGRGAYDTRDYSPEVRKAFDARAGL